MKTVRYKTWFRHEIAQILDAHPTATLVEMRKAIKGRCPIAKPYPRRVWNRVAKEMLGLTVRPDQPRPLLDAITMPGRTGVFACTPSKSTSAPGAPRKSAIKT